MTLDLFLSPVGMRPVPHCSGCDKPSPGKSLGAILAEFRRKGWLYLLGIDRDPAWGAKKVGEKLSFSPRASGGVTYRNDGYFGLVSK